MERSRPSSLPWIAVAVDALLAEERNTQARCDKAAQLLSQGSAAAVSSAEPAPVAVGALGDDEAYEAHETELFRGVPRWRREELKAKHAVEDTYFEDEPEDEEHEELEE